MTFQKDKLPPMPSKNWKKNLGLIRHSEPPPKKVPTVKASKPIAQVGKRTKERIALFGTETALHDSIWASRPHICKICGNNNFARAPWCFAHKLAKGQYKKYRYMPENIDIVCSVPCHEAVDRLYQGKTEEILDRRNALIDELDEILFFQKQRLES